MSKTKLLFIEFLRYSPTIGAFCYMVHYALLPFGIRTFMADYIIDLSVMAFIFLMVSSHLFGFCLLHRAFIVYIFTASMDIDLHHWFFEHAVHPLFMPVFMCGAGLVLFILLIIKSLRHETRTICPATPRSC